MRDARRFRLGLPFLAAALAGFPAGDLQVVHRDFHQLHNRLARPTYALADTVAAHEAVERGTLGNVIVTTER